MRLLALLVAAGGALAPSPEPGPPGAQRAGLGGASARPAARAGASGQMAQRAYLKASNTGAFDSFGVSVALSGRTAAVGAPNEASAATGPDGDPTSETAGGAGAVYVFEQRGTSWTQAAYLKASNTGATDGFGQHVALDGDTLAIAAPREDSAATGVNGDQTSEGARDSGAVYVLVQSGGTWSQQAYLKASNAEAFDAFGEALALCGDTLVVGAPGEDSAATGVDGDQTDNAAAGSGAAYVFVRRGMSWTQEAYLKASNPEALDGFGRRVAIADGRIAVGAADEDGGAAGVNGDPASNGITNSGAVYVFARDGSAWVQEAYVKASNPGTGDRFGQGLGLTDALLVVGAPGEDGSATGIDGNQDSNGVADAGAAYVFRREGTTWSQEAYFKASNTGVFANFGQTLACSGRTVVIASPFEAGAGTGVDPGPTGTFEPHSGALYLFEEEGGAWSQVAHAKASNTGASDWFASAVALSGPLLLAGAPGEDGAATGVDGDQASDAATGAGAAYAFCLPSRARVVFRNAGSNAASYTASPAVLGSAWIATVDNALAGQTSSILFAYDTAGAFPLPGGQTLLCLDLGSGELFSGANLHPVSSAGGVDTYSLAIPGLPELEDAVLHTQAVQLGAPPFTLSNAQDLTIGAY